MGERIERIQAWLQSAVGNMSGTDEEAIVAALLVIVVTGLIGGVAAKKLRQPLILGYILAGVIVGVFFRAGFGNVAETAVGSLANIGVALLLFSMGLEFSKADIRPIFKIAVFGALAQVFFTFVAGTGLAALDGVSAAGRLPLPRGRLSAPPPARRIGPALGYERDPDGALPLRRGPLPGISGGLGKPGSVNRQIRICRVLPPVGADAHIGPPD